VIETLEKSIGEANLAQYWSERSRGTIKARYISPHCVILHNSKGVFPTIGEGTWIGHFTILDGANGKLEIGENCSIASGVHIYTHSTHELVTEGKEKLVGNVELEDNVAVGANSVIFYGVKIGRGVVIPALTVVKPYTRIENVER
jgi:acetyltransferase-like isoleucine patch superfamily enzyme